MTVLELLTRLRRDGIEMELADDRVVCRAPKGALSPEMAAELRLRRDEIAAFLRDGLRDKPAGKSAPAIEPAPRRDLMPLSYTQERLWYLSQVETNGAVFNAPLCLRINGPLRPDVLQRCLDEIEARHEALRTTIVEHEGTGFQRIHAQRGIPLRVFDVRSADSAERTRSALALLDREAGATLDLVSQPAVRATLVRSAEDEHYLLVVTHHVFTDGSSMTIFLDELVALYEAFLCAKPSPLPAPSLQFADYAAWQRSWLRGPVLDEQLAFWTHRLAGELPVLEMPTDHPRPPVRGSSGAKEPLLIPKRAVDALAAIARGEGATTYMAMVALFNVLLYRHTGQEDLIVGTPVANRTRRESEAIFGYVANTLVLRTDCRGAPTFRELVRRVRDDCVAAFRHQDMPFQKVVEALHPPRDMSRTPIFQAFFTYEEEFSEPPRMADLALSRVIVGSTVARQDFSVFLRRVAAGVQGSFEYSTDLFTRDTVLRLIAHLIRLAESAAASPDTAIAQLPMLTDAEVAAFREWNSTELDVPDLLVHELFEARARATPHGIAIRSGESLLTYGELDRRANQVANALLAKGVGANDLVGVCIERSTEFVVSALGVLKSGASYVPLDPDFPAKRLGYIVRDANLRTVVTRRSLVTRIEAVGAAMLCVDDADVLATPATEVSLAPTPERRAYVIYTSGSTGEPKGVEVLHRNVVNFLTAMQARPGITENDVLLAVTTPSFDIALLELMLPLSAGACVAIAPRDVTMNGARLAELMLAHDVTIMQATPPTWRLLLDSGWVGSPQLKALCGGEALSADLAARLLPAVGELWNMYGPTETTIWSTCARLTDSSGVVTIGSPIANTVVRIVGPGGEQVPIGVRGELYIGGAGVARGYLGKPDLTRDRFMEDPLNARDLGPSLYRTGDTVRMHPDGSIEFIGRTDTQVKVQGHRIELGEIEAAIERIGEVREAAASVRSLASGDGRLVAYVVFHDGRQLTTSDVRRALREQLPAYMVPGLIVELDTLPRTPNGKIDRKSFPDALAAPGRSYSPPATDTERIVAEAWESLLSGQRVGRDDNFFELGGHSLLSIRAVSLIQKRIHAPLDPRLMFFQTVAQIAAGLEPALTAVGA